MIATESAGRTLCRFISTARGRSPRGRTMQPVTNPATGAVLAEVPYATEADVDRAVRTAHEAFLKWREVPVVDRVQVLYRFKTLLEKHADEVAAILTRENGKTTEDAKMEVRRVIQMVEVACGMPSLMMGDSLNDVAPDIDCKTIRQPIGVCAGITPFNFPAMVPMWMYPFAIACGNTFVLKPSEKVPLTPTRAIELLHDAGLPPGVLNLIHGGKEAVDALLHHPLVKAVSFVGSTPVAKYIYTTAAAEGKRVQALGGAKNHLVVMPDADMPKTVEAIIGSAFGAAGERCLAGSVLVPVGDAAGPLLDLLVKRTEGAGRGRWLAAGHRDGAAGDRRPLQEGGGLYRKGRRRRRHAAGAMAASAKRGRRVLPRTHHLRPRHARHDHRARRDFRTGALGDSRQDAGRGHRLGEPLALRQRDVDLHQQRQVRARVLLAIRSGHGGRQRRRRRPHGLLPLRRLEEFLLRRPARARQRRRQRSTPSRKSS